MARYAAFLRGMNLGGRRLTNEELCAAFRKLKCRRPAAFLASGNVVFETPEEEPAALEARLASGLEQLLSYPVPTFVRTLRDLGEIVARDPFSGRTSPAGGKLQVGLLKKRPGPADRQAALALQTPDDRLAVAGRELYWLPSGGVSESELDLRALERALSPVTIRTWRTLDRMLARFPPD